MKVLVLSPYPQGLLPWLKAIPDEYTVKSDPITVDYCKEGKFDFLISYGYRYLLHQDVLTFFPGRAINLHISLLPYCRGAHPVFWAICEGKPLGVTIHLLDAGLDTGNILIQQQTPLRIEYNDSFASLYIRLRRSIEVLFGYNWKHLRKGENCGLPQQGHPTSHQSRELDEWLAYLPDKWDTTIYDFCKQSGIRHPLMCHL